MGFYPYRTTDEELDETWDKPEAVRRGLPDPDARDAGPLAGPRGAAAGRDRDPAVRDDRQRRPAGTPGDAAGLAGADRDRGGQLRRPRRGHHHDLLRLLQPDAVAHPAGDGRRRAGAARSRSGRRGAAAGAGGLQPARPAGPHRHRPGPGAGRIAETRGQGRGRGDAVGRLRGGAPGAGAAPADARAARAHPRVARRGPARLGRWPSTRAASTATACCAGRCSSSTASAG